MVSHQAHAQCTEPFYKREVEVQIKSGPSTTSEEKRQMMELLKRFEEEAAASDEEEEDDDDDDEELANKLSGIDLGRCGLSLKECPTH